MTFAQLSHGSLDRNSSGLIIVQIGHGGRVCSRFGGIQKLLRHLGSKVDVVRAPPHFPAHLGPGEPRVAHAVREVPAAAVLGQRVRDARRHDGVHKSGLSVAFPAIQ